MLKQITTLFLYLFIVGVAVISSLSFAIRADALSIAVYDNIPDNTYMANGAILNGSFDINPAIPTNGEYQIPYDVENAYFMFRFNDDNDAILTGHTRTDYAYYAFSSGREYWVRYDRTYYYDEYERIQLNMEGQYSTDATEWYSMSQYAGSSYDGSYYYSGNTYLYFTYYYDYERGYTGDMTLCQGLGDEPLQSLSEDGIVNFTLQSYGDLYYNYGQLRAEINPNPVPIPTTIFLLGSGIVGLAGFRRKFRKN